MKGQLEQLVQVGRENPGHLPGIEMLQEGSGQGTSISGTGTLP